MTEHAQNYLQKSSAVLQTLLESPMVLHHIDVAGVHMAVALKAGKKIFSCGNGGSMCDAMHFASELIGKYKDVRDPLPAISLSDPSILSCVSNDFGYEYSFRRSIVALGYVGDVLLAISTSGKSENVLMAMRAAKQRGMTVIGLTGIPTTVEFAKDCDVCIRVPSHETNHIQEVHTKIIHILVEIIEKELEVILK